MLPIQFIFLLLIVTMPGQLAQAGGDGSTSSPLPALHTMPAWAAYLGLVASQALIVGFAIRQGRKTVRLLHEPSSATTSVITRMEILFARARWTTCALTAMFLFLTPLASQVVGWSEGTHFLKYLLLPEFLFLAPAVLAWVAMWSVAYFVEAALRERGLPFALARGQPVHEMPGMAAFLSLQMRHNFYPLLFLVFQGAVRALAAGLWTMTQPWDHEGNWADGVATVAALLSFFLILPSLLMKIWPTEPLTGALRRRLDAVAARYGVRFRQILLWRSQNTMINAAIIGWVPWGRYFLMSDALVESFPDPQLESVFAHEVGHGVHRHLHWLIAGVFGALGLAGGLSAMAAKLLTTNDATGQQLGLILATALLCVLVALVIWIVSPRFEHQADWFACRHMARSLREGTAIAAPREEGAPVLMSGLGTVAGPMAMLASGGPSVGAPEMLAALPPLPTPAEAVTKEAYLAGQYPHAASGPATDVDGEPRGQNDLHTGAAGQVPMVPELAGTEIFVSALESIADSLHRERTRRGWFHPSVARRVELVRQLAVDAKAEANFDRKMRQTRYGILGLAIGAVVAMGLAQMMLNPARSQKPSENPAPAAAAR